MSRSESKRPGRQSIFGAKGVEASRLRRRRHVLSRDFGLPEALVGGSLTLIHRRCGKPRCRCATGEGHPQWVLTYSVDGQRHVESIPHDLVEEVAPLVEEGQAFQRAVTELRSINAELLRLWRLEQRERARRSTNRVGRPRSQAQRGKKRAVSARKSTDGRSRR